MAVADRVQKVRGNLHFLLPFYFKKGGKMKKSFMLVVVCLYNTTICRLLQYAQLYKYHKLMRVFLYVFHKPRVKILTFLLLVEKAKEIRRTYVLFSINLNKQKYVLSIDTLNIKMYHLIKHFRIFLTSY